MTSVHTLLLHPTAAIISVAVAYFGLVLLALLVLTEFALKHARCKYPETRNKLEAALVRLFLPEQHKKEVTTGLLDSLKVAGQKIGIDPKRFNCLTFQAWEGDPLEAPYRAENFFTGVEEDFRKRFGIS